MIQEKQVLQAKDKKHKGKAEHANLTYSIVVLWALHFSHLLGCKQRIFSTAVALLHGSVDISYFKISANTNCRTTQCYNNGGS